jgi:predicted lipoprotein with Yx(FWY)xxD motif
MILRLVFICLLLGAFLVQAQDITVNVMQSETLGSYLTDADGNSLYLFVVEGMESQDSERMTEGVRSNAAPCVDKCLEFWPPLTGTAVQAGEGVDAELLYTADFGGMTMVVYNGWPLYYFIKDEKAGDTNGQGSGKEPNIWYLVNSDGSINETVTE